MIISDRIWCYLGCGMCYITAWVGSKLAAASGTPEVVGEAGGSEGPEMTVWNGSGVGRWPRVREKEWRQAEIMCPYAKVQHCMIYTCGGQHGDSWGGTSVQKDLCQL